MAKNQNDYEIQGKELFLSGQACPNGSSWQQAAMRRGWERQETNQLFSSAVKEKRSSIWKAQNTRYAIVSHIQALKSQALNSPVGSKLYARLSAKVRTLENRHSLLF